MRIYVAHSTGFDFKNELYAPPKEVTVSHTFIFPHSLLVSGAHRERKFIP